MNNINNINKTKQNKTKQVINLPTNMVYDNCVVCCEQIDNNNVVYYKLNNLWKQYMFCAICTENILENKWYSQINNIKNADCEKELKKLLNKPINKLTIDSSINTEEIDLIYFNNSIYSSELKKPSEINLDELNEKIKDVYKSMMLCNEYNYLFVY